MNCPNCNADTNRYGLFIPREGISVLHSGEWERTDPPKIRCLKCGFIWELKNEKEEKNTNRKNG